MRTIRIALFYVLVIASIFLPEKIYVAAQEAKLKQIVVLQSTREDVERLLGKSKYQGYVVAYDLEEGHLFIDYSGSNFCENGREVGWNVAKWVVIEVTYRPNNPPQFSSLNLDLTKFKKVRESPHSPDMVSYINEDDGVAYVINSDGTLNNTRHFPSTEFNHLLCHKQ